MEEKRKGVFKNLFSGIMRGSIIITGKATLLLDRIISAEKVIFTPR